ncbi:MAG: hypothetical protein J2P15_10020 [Micromonosporaceae bacterium]|nr:hypothetical protein [Micromonosporaceae bacterium]
MTAQRTDGYRLPGLWPAEQGRERSVARWESARREELVRSFAEHVYGHTPDGGALGDVTVHSRHYGALGGRAVRIEADLALTGPRGVRTASLLVYAPPAAGPDRPAPTLLGLNFGGNHASTTEPDVRIPAAAERIAAAHQGDGGAGGGGVGARGAQARRWPYPLILERGFAVATLWYEEIEIDLPGFASAGVRGLFPAGDHAQWGAIGAWAWALSRALDALRTIPELDASAVVVAGHSRLGKTALWAAAQDRRFAGVVSNESGCGGASLFRHPGVEDIAVITRARPHWFTPRFAGYRGAEHRLPVDQHQLIALSAPRLTHVASATRDAGADPVGEFLATLHASPIFELYGHRGTLPRGEFVPGAEVAPELAAAVAVPPPGTRIGGRLSYHLREGDHDMLAEDWTHILDAADEHLPARR